MNFSEKYEKILFEASQSEKKQKELEDATNKWDVKIRTLDTDQDDESYKLYKIHQNASEKVANNPDMPKEEKAKLKKTYDDAIKAQKELKTKLAVEKKKLIADKKEDLQRIKDKYKSI